MTQSYTWKNYHCTYDSYHTDSSETPLLLIHPIGVGLSRQFWQRFITQWYNQGNVNPIYNPDLLGCGEASLPRIAYSPEDWADQLQYFTEKVIQKPSILVAQGALSPVAIYCTQKFPDLVKSVVLSGPPAWELMKTATPPNRQKIAWNLFDSPFGNLFYRYARRRQFLESFSIRQLFGQAQDVDHEWLEELKKGSTDMETRHAVFAFLSGFWRQDYQDKIAKIQQPTLVIFGETASSISKQGAKESPDERLQAYLKHFPNSQGCKISGRNVLPYESTAEFIEVVSKFVG